MSSIFGNDADGSGSGGATGPSDYDVSQDIIIQAVENSIPSLVNLNPIIARLDDLELKDVNIDLDVLGLETSKLSIVDHDIYKSSIVVEQNVQNGRLLELENEQIIQNGLIASNGVLIASKVSTSSFNSQISDITAINSSLQSQITTEKNKNDVQDTRLSSVESINAIQSTAISDLQTSVGAININGKLDTAVYDANNIVVLNKNNQQDSRLNNLEASDVSIASSIDGINANLNNLVIVDNGINSRVAILEARPFPITASLVNSNTITGVAGNDVQTNLVSLKTLIDGISTSSSGFPLEITTLINNMDVRWQSNTKITEITPTSGPSNLQAKLWSDIAKIDQDLSSNRTTGPLFKRLNISAGSGSPTAGIAFSVRGAVTGNNDNTLFQINSHGLVNGFGRDVISGPIFPCFEYSRNGIKFPAGTATVSTFEGNSVDYDTMITESKRFTSHVNQQLNTNSTPSFSAVNIIDSSGNTSNKIFNIKNSAGNDLINAYNGGQLDIFSTTGSPLIRTIAGSNQLVLEGENRLQGPTYILNRAFNLNNVNGLQFKSVDDFSTERAFITMTNPTNQNLSAAYMNSGRIFLYNPNNSTAICTEINTGSIILRSLTSLENKFVANNNGSLQLFGDTRSNPANTSFEVNTTGIVQCESVFVRTDVSAPSALFNTMFCNIGTIGTGPLIFNTGLNNIVINNIIGNQENGTTQNNIILGNNIFNNSTNSICVGKNNTITNNAAALMLGNSNIISGNTGTRKQIILGDGNQAILESSNTLIGHNNKLENNDGSTFSGISNICIGSNWNSTYLGSYTTENGALQFNTILLGDPGSGPGGIVFGGGLKSIASSLSLPVRMTISRTNVAPAYQFVVDTSTIRDKENVNDVDYNVQKFMQIKPKIYNRKNDDKKNIEHGMIAEELNELFPEFVMRDNEKCMGIDYARISCLLINVVQKQQQQIDSLLTLFKSELQ